MIDPHTAPPALRPPSEWQNARLREQLEQQRREDDVRHRVAEQLRPGQLHRLAASKSLIDQREFIRRFWAEAVRLEEAGLSETRTARLEVAWRQVRALAQMLGMVAHNEELIVGLNVTPSPWTTPLPLALEDLGSPKEAREKRKQALWPCMELMASKEPKRQATDLEPHKRPLRRPSLSFAPPPVPARFFGEDGHEVTTEYDPYEDEALCRWCASFAHAADVLALALVHHESGQVVEDPTKVLAIQLLSDPRTARRCFPHPQEVMQFESFIVNETMQTLTRGRVGANEYLRDSLGLSDSEISSVAAMAMQQLREYTEADTEEKRALLELRLEDFVKRSQDALDLNSEMKGLKMLTIVQGLTRTDPENASEEFERESRRVIDAKPRDVPQLEVIDVPQLPPVPE